MPTPSKFIGNSSPCGSNEGIHAHPCAVRRCEKGKPAARRGRKGYRRIGRERSTMRMPGLNAEASLYTSKGRYRAAPVAHPNVPQVVVAQSEKSDCEYDCQISFGECLHEGIPVITCSRAHYYCHRGCRFLDPWEH
jgi:hypothetical protein